MAAFFPGTAGISLSGAAAAAVAPFTVGMMLRPGDVSTVRVPLLLYSSANPSTQQFFMYLNGTKWAAGAYGPTNQDEGDFAAGTVVAGAWYFLLLRFISPTNRRYAALFPDGTIQHLAQTTNIGNPTGIDSAMIGNDPDSHTWFGDIAEYWIAGADVWAAGSAIDATAMRQLAMQGPWSVPSIAETINEYRPLISKLDGGGRDGENWHRNRSPIWTNTGATRTPGPPLAAGYRRPYRRNLNAIGA